MQEGGGGIYRERVTWKHTLPYVKQPANGNLLYQQGAEIAALQQPRGVGGGREVQEGEDICIPVADSCYWMAETKTIL